MNEEIHESLYKSPNCAGIRANIHSKQSKLLLALYDMPFVASTADDAFTINPPVKQSIVGKHREEYERLYEESLASSAKNFKKNINVSKKLDKKVKAREFLFNEILAVCPDFCKNMEEKVSPEDFSIYRKEKRKLKNVITVSQERYESFDNFLLAHQDRLAEIIDTEDFSKACSIEDKFVISELDRFFELLPTLPREQSHHLQKKSIKPEGAEPISIVDIAQRVKKERLDRLEKYSHIQELYKKLREHPYIRIEKPSYEGEDR